MTLVGGAGNGRRGRQGRWTEVLATGSRNGRGVGRRSRRRVARTAGALAGGPGDGGDSSGACWRSMAMEMQEREQ